ncbi:deoxyribodipyrimidine photo-lyase [Sphingomonas sp. NFR04]|uniref:FAD-binding domain-containing protein n=1 Tax=Sphingomonas sp. NFR04 TaxID=1566283 RepID=UPI0008E24052|nr:FAD-binding domain-containing protein [Sphingomonas sp. NFR04]SFJ86056.1 deoxyribodipyrimidine photo-lyase [Sphingomonas sp. NFR04]
MLLSASGRGPILSFDFPLSRSAALGRLAAFLPHAGSDYARHRNEERGQGQHHAVSRLSAALRRRLISEAEVAEAVVRMHGAGAAAKFVAELLWRTYWKGWLEQRPSIWHDWRADCARLTKQGLPEGYAAAIEGRTGIDAFDAWLRELRETGYLHNWARMQFASIWIFTLRLPWQLGAAFTFHHFVDADPASNTLSWRWVAGLHTQGKAYLADAERIKAQTGGRFDPKGLAITADVPRETPSPDLCRIRMPTPPDPQAPALLLLTPEDLSLETEMDLQALDVRRVVACRAHCSGAADLAAVADGLQRASGHWRAPALWVDDMKAALAVAQQDGVAQIVTGYAPVGPVAESLAAQREGTEVRIAEHRRAWDERAWPYCRKGYFALAQHIPALLDAAELAPLRA